MDNMTLLVIGSVASPIITVLGLYWQYRKDRQAEANKQLQITAEAKKAEAEADKIEAETKALDFHTEMDNMNFYIGMVNMLRTEVNTLTELSRTNGAEIAKLTAKLITADEEKKRLAIDKAELLKRIERYESEVQSLRAEVATLRQQK